MSYISATLRINHFYWFIDKTHNSSSLTIHPVNKNDSTLQWCHMSVMASQITGNSIVLSTPCSGVHQRKYQRLHYWSFAWGVSICGWCILLRNGQQLKNISLSWHYYECFILHWHYYWSLSVYTCVSMFGNTAHVQIHCGSTIIINWQVHV